MWCNFSLCRPHTTKGDRPTPLSSTHLCHGVLQPARGPRSGERGLKGPVQTQPVSHPQQAVWQTGGWLSVHCRKRLTLACHGFRKEIRSHRYQFLCIVPLILNGPQNNCIWSTYSPETFELLTSFKENIIFG